MPPISREPLCLGSQTPRLGPQGPTWQVTQARAQGHCPRRLCVRLVLARPSASSCWRRPRACPGRRGPVVTSASTETTLVSGLFRGCGRDSAPWASMVCPGRPCTLSACGQRLVSAGCPGPRGGAPRRGPRQGWLCTGGSGAEGRPSVRLWSGARTAAADVVPTPSAGVQAHARTRDTDKEGQRMVGIPSLQGFLDSLWGEAAVGSGQAEPEARR